MSKPADRIREVMETLPPPVVRHTLDECAATLLDWMSSIEPSWAERIEILRQERNFTSRDIAASLMAYPLDHSLHMEITTNPILEHAGIKTDPKVLTCEMCGKEFERKYSGQRPFCSNRCANGHDAGERVLANSTSPDVA